MAVYALTIFTGAFLLFQVQPLIGKYILPWFGGGPGVWTTCMLFFQVVLLGGYAYAHFTSRWLKPRAQALVHMILLAAALALLPITPGDTWKPHAGSNPTLQILALLGACLGLPYFMLSTTGPLIQQWFSRSNPGRSPYRLYALSNVGSLLALVSYPFFFETHFTRKAQTGFWAWGLVVYVLCCGLCAVKLWKSGVGSPNSKAPTDESASGSESLNSQPSSLNWLLWLLLPACASVLLLATTNKLCQDVAVIPFLWVLPLALYLLSFIICFDSPRWYKRFPFTLALVVALGGVCWALFAGLDWPMWKQVATYSGALFVCCMVCHGELYRLKPDPRHLTAFYLMIATGGALGGLLVAVVAPVVFTDYYELHWALLLCGLLFVVVCALDKGAKPEVREPLRTATPPEAGSGIPAAAEAQAQTPRAGPLGLDSWRWLACALPLFAIGGLDWLVVRMQEHLRAVPKSGFIGLHVCIWALAILLLGAWAVRRKYRDFRYWRLLACAWLGAGVVALGVALWKHARESREAAVATSRNFYGVLTVYEYRKPQPYEHHLVLQHGRITHGLQFVDKAKATWPTSYYGMDSGIGLGLCALPKGPRRIGVLGLGTGSITVYGRPADYIRIYEINPQVKALATSRFTYLSNCQAKVELVPGDARLSMEQELPQEFDLLALDAFSSDAVPVHLLTREAFEVYGRHMKTNGVIAVNISNRYLDLEPVVANLARQFRYKMALVDAEENEDEWWIYGSTWALLTRNEQLLNSEPIQKAACTEKTRVKIPLWTDDFASLFQILK